MIMKKISIRLLIGLSLVICYFPVSNATTHTIASPDGKVIVTVSDDGGSAKYQVNLGDKIFIRESPLGLKLNFDDLTESRHTEYTTARERRDGKYVTTFPEHLRKCVVHATSYTLMLLPTKLSKF